LPFKRAKEIAMRPQEDEDPEMETKAGFRGHGQKDFWLLAGTNL